MPAPTRLGKLTLVLVPTEGADERTVVHTAQQACCIAIREGLQPIHPLLLYGMFLPRDELDPTHLKPNAKWWARRASGIWVCFPLDVEVELDPLTYDILMHNETQGYVPRRTADPARVPVHQLTWNDADRYDLQRMSKRELSSLLRCNIVPGMLRGGL